MITTTTTTAPSLDEYKSFHGMLCKPRTAKRCIESFNNGVALFADQKEYEYDDDDDDINLNHLSNFDFNNTTAELGSGLPFNIWTYYLLVVLSLTGLSSILRITQCLKAVEYNLNFDDDNQQAALRLVFRKGDDKHIESTEIKNEKNKLRIPQNAIDYVINRSISLGPLIDTTTTKKTSLTFSSSSLSEQHKRKQSTNDNDNGNGKDNENEQTSIQLIRCFEYDFGWGALSVMMLHFKCQPNGRIHLVEVFKTDTLLGYILEKNPLKLLYYIKSILRNQNQRQKQQ